MEFGINCVTVCAFDWLLFVFYYFYILYDTPYILIIPKYCGVIKFYCLDSVGYYPAAHSRHLGVNSRVLWTGTSHSPGDNANKSASGNQWSA